MAPPLHFDPRHPCAVPCSEEAARGAEAGPDVQNPLPGLEVELRSAVVEGGVAVVVQAVEGGGVGVCPGGFGGEEGEVGAGAGEVVEGHAGDVGVGAGFGALGAFVVFDGVGSHFSRCCAVDIGWSSLGPSKSMRLLGIFPFFSPNLGR